MLRFSDPVIRYFLMESEPLLDEENHTNSQNYQILLIFSVFSVIAMGSIIQLIVTPVLADKENMPLVIGGCIQGSIIMMLFFFSILIHCVFKDVSIKETVVYVIFYSLGILIFLAISIYQSVMLAKYSDKKEAVWVINVMVLIVDIIVGFVLILIICK